MLSYKHLTVLLLFAKMIIKQLITAVNNFLKGGYMCNKEIREAAKQAGVCLWQIAERLGMNDGNFSRKLRRELSEVDRARVMEIIAELSKEAI